MIELRGIKDYSHSSIKVEGLPTEIQQQIKQTVTILDESYGEIGKRTFEGGKVVVLENQEDAEYANRLYGLSNNEFADEVHTAEDVYLMLLVIFGMENNIMIVGKKEILLSYV